MQYKLTRLHALALGGVYEDAGTSSAPVGPGNGEPI